MLTDILEIIKTNQPIAFERLIKICIDQRLGVIRPKMIIASLIEMGTVMEDEHSQLRLK